MSLSSHSSQLTAVVLSLVAVHDTQDVLQDGWTQIQIQPHHRVCSRHGGRCGETCRLEVGAGRLAAFTPQILVAQAGVRVQAEAPAHVQGPAGFRHGVFRGDLREGARGGHQLADGGG